MLPVAQLGVIRYSVGFGVGLTFGEGRRLVVCGEVGLGEGGVTWELNKERHTLLALCVPVLEESGVSSLVETGYMQYEGRGGDWGSWF